MHPSTGKGTTGEPCTSKAPPPKFPPRPDHSRQARIDSNAAPRAPEAPRTTPLALAPMELRGRLLRTITRRASRQGLLQTQGLRQAKRKQAEGYLPIVDSSTYSLSMDHFTSHAGEWFHKKTASFKRCGPSQNLKEHLKVTKDQGIFCVCAICLMVPICRTRFTMPPWEHILDSLRVEVPALPRSGPNKLPNSTQGGRKSRPEPEPYTACSRAAVSSGVNLSSPLA